MKIDGIIFDLDGTLWDSTDVVLKAWNETLKTTKEIKNPITREQLQSIMGMQLPQIGDKLFPYLNKELQMKIMKQCCEYENSLINKEGGNLYCDLEETIEKLYKKYPLFIVSNCQSGYIEAFFSYHKLEKYFKDFEHAGNSGFSKGENIKRLMERNGLKSPIYIGDTQGDCDASRLAAIPFVYASYGFGKVKEYDYYIDSIQQILDLV